MTKFNSWALFNDFSNFIASIPLPGTKICAPKMVPKYVHNSYFIIKSGCCKQLILYETNRSSDFYAGFSTFLGFWYQVCIPYWKSLLPNQRKQGYRQEHKLMGSHCTKKLEMTEYICHIATLLFGILHHGQCGEEDPLVDI